jgi:single-strand DNA-binding protein
MNKGQRVLVQGRVTYGEVKDENGVGHITTSIIADDVTFFSKSPHDSSSSNDENP